MDQGFRGLKRKVYHNEVQIKEGTPRTVKDSCHPAEVHLMLAGSGLSPGFTVKAGNVHKAFGNIDQEACCSSK